MSPAAVSAADGTARIVTFGCRLNVFESEVIRDLARQAGLDRMIIVNSCAVTAEAERQVRQTIRRLRRESPDARIVVTGCAAQVAAARFAAMPEVSHVLGNAEKLDPAAWATLGRAADAPRLQVGDIMSVRETAGHLVAGFDGHTRAFVEVQQGCDHRCTFCIIPYARGPSRSVPADRLVEHARTLVGNGIREMVLTGVDLTAYGRDLPDRTTLGAMVRRLLDAVPELPRLRLSSVDPAEIDADLWRAIAEERRLMPHLHLSLQAGDDIILKRMRRRHSRQGALAACHRARAVRPEIALGADLIAGFPTESEEMFARTLSLIDDAALDYVHVFAFSPRPGTPAARMPQLPRPLVDARAARLRMAAAEARRRFHARQPGSHARVLAEGDGRSGHAENFASVRLDRPMPRGAIVDVEIVGVRPDGLDGRSLTADR